mgnify:CR=1 FL=1
MTRAAGHHRQIANGQIAMALGWEFWACGCVWIVAAPLMAMSLPCLIFVAITWPERSFRVGELGDVFQFPLYWTSLIMLGPSVLSALGNPQHRYTLPASNFLIVATLMVCAMATVFAQYAAMALSLNALFDVGWPVLGPSLLAAVLVAWCQAMLWSTSNSTGLQVLACALSAAVLGIGIVVWGSPGRTWTAHIADVDAWQLLKFAAAAAICVGVGTFGFSKVRAGAGFDVRPIIDWLSRAVMLRNKSQRARFSSPAGAQLWLEWTERGRALPAGTAVFGLALLIVAFFIPAKDGFDFTGAYLAFFFAPLSVIGMFFGSRSKLGEFGSFNGSRPLSDGKVAGAILRSFTLSLISSAVVWLAFFVLVNVIVIDRRVTSDFTHAIRTTGVPALTALIVLGGLAVWSGVGLVTALTLAGRRVVGIALPAFFGVWMAGILIAICLRPAIQDTFMQAYTAAWLLACVVAVAATFFVSWRRKLIFMPSMLLAALLISITFAAALGSGWIRIELIRHEPFGYVLLLGCGLIPIPLAAAPLAVYVNRHR